MRRSSAGEVARLYRSRNCTCRLIRHLPGELQSLRACVGRDRPVSMPPSLRRCLQLPVGPHLQSRRIAFSSTCPARRELSPGTPSLGLVTDFPLKHNHIRSGSATSTSTVAATHHGPRKPSNGRSRPRMAETVMGACFASGLPLSTSSEESSSSSSGRPQQLRLH
jgi:hypothetical protein